MEIVISVDEVGRISLNVGDDIPQLLALGLLEVAKDLILRNPGQLTLVEKE